MTEHSSPWDGTTLGDAVDAPYLSSEDRTRWWTLFGASAPAAWSRSAVSLGGGITTSLQVTGTASPVAVAAGFALVEGLWYYNDASMNVAVATPAANPRIDRIILRADIAAQTVRCVRLPGSESATPSPPALTQTAATWEVSIAQVYITTGGVISVGDERYGAVGLGAVTDFRDIVGRTREVGFDHFSLPGVATGSIYFNATTTGTGAVSSPTTSPSVASLTTGANASSTAQLDVGTKYYVTAPGAGDHTVVLRARVQGPAAIDAQTAAVLRLNNAAANQSISLGFNGSISTGFIVAYCINGGTTSRITTVAFGASAWHTLAIVIRNTSEVYFLVDDLIVAMISTNVPNTALQPQLLVANGTTATARVIACDWIQLLEDAT